MSDLISRKKICDYIKGKINPYGKPFEGTAYELGLEIMRYIDAMESDYDVIKVVAELRRMSGNGYRDVDGDYVPPMIETKNEIEIVKAGGDNV